MKKINNLDKVNIFGSTLYGIKGDRLLKGIQKNKIHEWSETILIPQFLRVNNDIIDVGANIGYYCALCSLFMGHDGKIHAFEAHPVTSSLLEKTIRENNWKNVKLNKVAVSDKSGHIETAAAVEITQEQMDSGFNLGGWSLLSTGERKNILPCVSLDDYVEKENIERLRLIKIDVEGYESKVLAGAIHVLKRFKPFLMVEFLARTPEQHEQCMKCVEIMHSAGYNLKKIVKGVVVNLQPCEDSDFNSEEYHYNIIAIHSSNSVV